MEQRESVLFCIKRGYKASKKKVGPIMKDRHLQSVHTPRKQRSLTNSRTAMDASCPNLIQDVRISHPFQAITSDISYLTATEGRQYICKIKDVASGMVLAQTVSDRMKASGHDHHPNYDGSMETSQRVYLPFRQRESIQSGRSEKVTVSAWTSSKLLEERETR